MNAIENAQLCSAASDCLRNGVGSLVSMPGFIKKIITTKAWEERKLRHGEIVKLKNLRELITSKPLKGWGEDPEKIKSVIASDTEVLDLFREAMKEQPGPKVDGSSCNNITESKPTGTSKAYTVSRLKREAPKLFQEVCDGKLSANAAAIKAGFRKKPTADEQCLKSFAKAENRLNVLRSIIGGLEVSERMIVLDWLNELE